MYSLFNTLSKIKQQHCVTLATHFSHALARWSRDVHKDISSIDIWSADIPSTSSKSALGYEVYTILVLSGFFPTVHSHA